MIRRWRGSTATKCGWVCLLGVVVAAIALAAAGPALAAPSDPSYSAVAQNQARLPLGALGAATFNQDDLITDLNFTDPYCLTQAQVQSFLAAQPGTLATYRAVDHLGVERSAAAIVYLAAKAWQVSPRVILATLQKEEGLLSATAPSATALDWAMGCGCPDSGGKNTTYEGFGKQVWYGAESLHDDGQGWQAGMSKVCGDGTVKPADQATLSLYCYTPWIGLAGGGNKLFWTLYWQYFGDPLAVDTVAPVATVQGADALWHSKPVSLTISAVDNAGGSGVTQIEHSLDGGAWTSGASLTVAAPATHAGDGVHTVRCRAIDDAGNVSPVQTCTVSIDTTPPRPVANWTATATHGATATLRYLVADHRPGSPTATVTIRVRTLTGGLVRKLVERDVPIGQRLSARFTCHLAAGSYRFFVYATDAAGNVQSVVARNTLRVR